MKHIPLGIRDFLPSELKSRQKLVNQMKEVVEAQGFEQMVTPSIEYYDSISHALGEDLEQNCIVFFDGSGSRLVLRPDHTAAIARIVSSRLSDQLPLKLYYNDSVFRKDPTLGETEIFQFGLEQIGGLSIQDEVNMVKTAYQLCDCVGIKDIEVHVGHTGLFKDNSDQDIHLLKSGELLHLNELPKKLALNTLDQSHILYSVANKFKALDIADKIYINESLYKDPSYYNGLYFDIVSKKFGKVLGSGGRYDRVLNEFGCESNAFGFALRLHYIEEAIHG